MRAIRIPILHCYRCIYTWTPVKSPVRMCPRCKSKLWDVPKLTPVRLGNGLGIEEVLGKHRASILTAARRLGAHRIRVFGSVRRREARPDSDVDLLVSWKPGSSILDKASLMIEIERIVGRRVDLVNDGALHWAIAPQVEAEAVPL